MPSSISPTSAGSRLSTVRPPPVSLLTSGSASPLAYLSESTMRRRIAMNLGASYSAKANIGRFASLRIPIASCRFHRTSRSIATKNRQSSVSFTIRKKMSTRAPRSSSAERICAPCWKLRKRMGCGQPTPCWAACFRPNESRFGRQIRGTRWAFTRLITASPTTPSWRDAAKLICRCAGTGCRALA